MVNWVDCYRVISEYVPNKYNYKVLLATILYSNSGLKAIFYVSFEFGTSGKE